MATLCIQRRVDALNPRLSGFYVRLLLLSGLSWAVRSAELVLFTFTRRLVAKSVGMGTHALEALGVGVFLGSALGGPLFGLLADARGRRAALLLAMTLSLAGLALSAVAKKDYHVIAARVVAGVGLGGELPAATVLVQELSPRPMRGRMVALLEAFTGLGGVVGVALAFGLAPQLGWRVTYLAICGCVVYVGVLRFGIPESPRWLASVGRVDEALLAVEKLEREHGRYENATVQDKPMTGEATTVTSLDPFPVSTLVLSVLWAVMAVSAYALGVYVPSLISLWGFNMFSRWSTMALLGVAQAFGCVLASLVLGDCDRKQALVCFVAAAAVAAVVYSHAPWNGPLVIGGSFVVQI
jgi:putative MFS transporter